MKTDSAFLMLRSKLNQSFRIEGNKEYLKHSVRQLKMGIQSQFQPVSVGIQNQFLPISALRCL